MNKQSAALVIVLIVAVMQCGIAQTVHQLPFASSGNIIELTVANTATTPLTGVVVEATDVPPWLKIAETKQRIALIKAQQEMLAMFKFAVDKTAPVQQSHTLNFVITTPTGEKWTKAITLAVAPPEKFEAYQNFPNPFNPATAISYQLAGVSRVSLKIYNLLGQEVASLVDGDRLAGYHQETWDATRYASGVYVYQLIATDAHGWSPVARKRMLLLK
ncbi:MAG: 5'-nucleotidase protein [Bacteroidetes bacterium]|nr:5'-nucleotidase protein [Bacteroidota bacterium]